MHIPGDDPHEYENVTYEVCYSNVAKYYSLIDIPDWDWMGNIVHIEWFSVCFSFCPMFFLFKAAQITGKFEKNLKFLFYILLSSYTIGRIVRTIETFPIFYFDGMHTRFCWHRIIPTVIGEYTSIFSGFGCFMLAVEQIHMTLTYSLSDYYDMKKGSMKVVFILIALDAVGSLFLQVGLYMGFVSKRYIIVTQICSIVIASVMGGVALRLQNLKWLQVWEQEEKEMEEKHKSSRIQFKPSPKCPQKTVTFIAVYFIHSLLDQYLAAYVVSIKKGFMEQREVVVVHQIFISLLPFLFFFVHYYYGWLEDKEFKMWRLAMHQEITKEQFDMMAMIREPGSQLLICERHGHYGYVPPLFPYAHEKTSCPRVLSRQVAVAPEKY